MQDPVLSILNLLQSNWNAGNTSLSSAPAIHSGWHSADSNDPQVTVTNPEESPINGGVTGYSGMTGGPNTGTQDIDGSVAVDCWADREVTTENPKKIAYEFTEEVKRIVQTNQTNATDLEIIAYGGRNFVPPEDDEDPPTFHYNVSVGYLYHERP